MILQLRIDERLTHGQVCITWINTLGATHVLIVNDAVANDEFQKSIMGMGIPSGTKSLFATVERAAATLNNPKADGMKIFVVVKTPQDALALLKQIKDTQKVSVNLANYGQLVKADVKNKWVFNGCVKLDEDDVACTKEIMILVKEVYHNDIVGRPKKEIKF